MEAPTLVLFDLDGTLVETAPEISDAVNDTLRHFGWPPVEESLVADWIGHGTAALLRHAVARATASPPATEPTRDLLERVCRVYDRYYAERCGTRGRLYPGAREVLAALRTGGSRLAVVTNKERRYTERVLAIHGLDDAFDRVIAGDTLPTKKPDPAGVLDCLAAFGLPPARALFVGDSSIDAATARNAGVRVWLLPHGYNMGEPIEGIDSDRLLPDFATLLRELGAGTAFADARASGRPRRAAP
jgi:phosphoglycolate phosphatase